MKFDYPMMYDAQAYSSPNSTEFDLGPDPGRTGNQRMLYVEGAGIAAAGNVTIAIETSATSGSGHAQRELHTMTPAQLNAGFWCHINSKHLDRYFRMVLGGSPSAGTITGGIVSGLQTAV